MADILWRPWQVEHIERKHHVSAQEFEEAWDDPNREDLAQDDHPEWGPYFRSLGPTSDGRLLEMLWRWQNLEEGNAVWPITAFFKDRPPRQRTHLRRRRRT
jgi:hypothetical protein